MDAEPQDWLDENWESETRMLSFYNADGICLDTNLACSNVIGRAVDEVVGRSAYAFFHSADIPLISAHHDASLKGKWPGSWVCYRIKGADGEYRWVRSQTRLVHTADGVDRLVVLTEASDASQCQVIDPSGKVLARS